MVPDSPMPFAPSSFIGVGVADSTSSNDGSSARRRPRRSRRASSSTGCRRCRTRSPPSRPARSPRHAAVDLAFGEQRVQDLARVVAATKRVDRRPGRSPCRLRSTMMLVPNGKVEPDGFERVFGCEWLGRLQPRRRSSSWRSPAPRDVEAAVTPRRTRCRRPRPRADQPRRAPWPAARAPPTHGRPPPRTSAPSASRR